MAGTGSRPGRSVLRRRLPVALALVIALGAVGAACGKGYDGGTSVAGTYVNETEGEIELRDDGTFEIRQPEGGGTSGTYSVDGTTITFVLEDGAEFEGRIEGNTLTDPDGKEFVRQ